MAKKKLVVARFTSNWADEMDVNGFAVFTQDQWKEYRKLVKSMSDNYTLGIGTNQELEYINGQEVLRDITTKSVTEKEMRVIESVFGVRIVKNIFKNTKNSYGHFPTASDVSWALQDQEESSVLATEYGMDTSTAGVLPTVNDASTESPLQAANTETENTGNL